MKNTITNYARFYSLLNRTPYSGDRNDLKEQLVWKFTNLRTTSLKEMTPGEYNNMCLAMEKDAIPKPENAKIKDLKAARSAVLTRLQKYGIDTTDFDNVDAFCQDTRIAGKKFRQITLEELKALIPKLESMIKKSQNVMKLPKYKLN